MKQLKIMVVDDALLSQKKLIATLEELGHAVVAAANSGTKALTAYEHYRPDLVTMDITMPEMDGIAATRWILGRHPEARILIVTSHAEKNTVLDALEAGAKGYIIKPFQADKLRQAIRRAMTASEISP
ncbi:two-component system chemotaxis response regulator CheY [Herbaspirillum sp. Sphag1AN]|uniref:response regulator n=1 Tax=unclassified Herbaspirillum TaxID=2624150 RepID=UPI0016077B82|nr:MULTISPECIES: response regulator [unclassified Herbaspirillum]MBB3212573.1 two-component system chemotaxis response regulator CheY [Herbaspirillum sp. Sphag1AN]MBB3245770.1 two-component system chemotaxis response regulator CheY [Herbaspirillum sp. Sphag64]